MPATKPKLAQLKTPVTATFPSELSALSASARTPRSAVPSFLKDEFAGGIKTPITPPTAYMDFLKAMTLPSPIVPAKRSASGSPAPEEDPAQDSVPSTASSEHSDCSCRCGGHSSTAPISPYPAQPMSAPPMSVTSFPGLNVPSSPAVSTMDSPVSVSIRSPFSARSVRSPFDWETALKARYSPECRAHKPANKSVRQIREVVTRTVTYTPRMNPAPKGKRRKTHATTTKPVIGTTTATAATAAATAAAAAAATEIPISRMVTAQYQLSDTPPP
ncbi:hypothetical protein GGR50DRAFT_699788 [Xylaria sp. CBS 124048]|nr:hypothetical protein GGR50DRAFT_699788 [Xylaria sp. CBS 124048]